MPLEFARFPFTIHPSGFLGTDGRMYVIASGQSSGLATLSPSLVIDLSTVGGTNSTGEAFLWASVVWVFGRAYTFAPDLLTVPIVNVIVKASSLGSLSDALLEVARAEGLLQPRRPAQARAIFRRLAAQLPSETTVLAAADTVEIASLIPSPAAPAAPAPPAPANRRRSRALLRLDSARPPDWDPVQGEWSQMRHVHAPAWRVPLRVLPCPLPCRGHLCTRCPCVQYVCVCLSPA